MLSLPHTQILQPCSSKISYKVPRYSKTSFPYQFLYFIISNSLGFAISSFLFLFLSADNALVLTRDERLENSRAEQIENSSTIAAIVTSMGGSPAAVGIVRLSGPRAVTIVGSLFRPAARKKTKNLSPHSWRPTSHVVEYGAVLDQQGDVIDEVR